MDDPTADTSKRDIQAAQGENDEQATLTPAIQSLNGRDASSALPVPVQLFLHGYSHNGIDRDLIVSNTKLAEAGLPLLEEMTVVEWNPELQNRAREQWEATRSKWSISPATAPGYRKLFRSCLSYAACTPSDIVGIKNNLLFQIHPTSGERTEETSFHTLFSDSFCAKLDLLVTHPAFSAPQPGTQADSIALAIQYAVILRTDDRRSWHFTMREGFMLVFQDRTKRGRCKKEAHAEIRAEYIGGDYLSPLSSLSNIFLALEKVIQTPENVIELEDDDLYRATEDDLTAIITALDDMIDPDTEARVYKSAEMYNATATSILPPLAPPACLDDMHVMHAEVMFEEQRRIIMYHMYHPDSIYYLEILDLINVGYS
ncbi:hypothetical protein NLG97_g677 [Lecanicillium saksenae]|uniref:Uncharacterized protein n=1 Tax=Lecanicillium saksenae TaxID=468837 RepID=A0ACC1R7U5_9HYPO|nr:hypothetical protein NLG97_g677 [Lecanicillium saksenae]